MFDSFLQVVVCSCQGGVQDTRQLTLTCTKEFSFPFDSCFSLKTKQRGLLYNLGWIQITSVISEPRAAASQTPGKDRENTCGNVSRLLPKLSVITFTLTSAKELKKKEKERKEKKKNPSKLFFSWLLFASVVLFLTVGFSRCTKILL